MRGYQERCGLEDTDIIARKYLREILLTLILHKLQKNNRCSQSFLTMNSFYELCFREFKIDFNNDSLSRSLSLFLSYVFVYLYAYLSNDKVFAFWNVEGTKEQFNDVALKTLS